jgi:hypothetical protein
MVGANARQCRSRFHAYISKRSASTGGNSAARRAG